LPIGTAVHERTFQLCESLNYREWSGYYTVSVYETHHEHEYNAIRNAAALIDVSPLFKYFVTGRDATKLVNRVITRDINKVAVGQVIYCCWCDEQGKVIDDGTISRLAENEYRWTAADPSLRWFRQNAVRLDVSIEDISEKVAALALQGPTSGRLLKKLADADIANLKYFRLTPGKIGGVSVDISRTGYTGDLGYEIWMPWNDAVKVWDAIMDGGREFDIHAAGMLALDVARIEAGLILIEVDYFSSKKALIESQKYNTRRTKSAWGSWFIWKRKILSAVLLCSRSRSWAARSAAWWALKSTGPKWSSDTRTSVSLRRLRASLRGPQCRSIAMVSKWAKRPRPHGRRS
jgi:aminomethyltransferase